MGAFKVEWQLFFSKKNKLIIVLAVLGMLLAYQLQEHAYQNVHMTMLENYSESKSIAQDNLTRYTSALDELKDEQGKNNEKQTLKKNVRMWNDVLNYYNDFTMFLHTGNTQYDDLIQKEVLQLDKKIPTYLKEGLEAKEVSKLYQMDPYSIHVRKLQARAYGNTQWLFKQTEPTGVYLLQDAVSFTSVAGIILILAMVLLNFDIWSNDFETHAYRLLFLCAGNRKQIYMRRLLYRILFTLVLLFVMLFVYVGCGILFHGSGITTFYIANKEALTGTVHTFHTISEAQDIMMRGSSIIAYAIALLVFYILFAMAAISFLSLLLKQSMLTFLVVLLLFVYMYLSAPFLEAIVWNPMNYLQLMDVLQGTYGLSILTVYGSLGGVAIVFGVGGYFLLRRKDLR